MSYIRQAIEVFFEKLGFWVYDNKIKTLIATLLCSCLMIMHLPQITIDTTNESFFRESDNSLVDYEKFKDQFGKDELFIIAIEDPNIFSFAFLKKLKALHDELEANVPYLDDITSLINARNTRGEKDVLIVEDLLENWPESKENLAKIKQRVMSNPMYINTLISEDAKLTTILIKAQTYLPQAQDAVAESVLDGFDDMGSVDRSAQVPPAKSYLSNKQNSEIDTTIKRIIDKYRSDFKIYITGSPAVVAALDREIIKIVQIFLPLCFLMVGVFLAVMFRRISGVVYPFLILIFSLLSCFGLMAFFKMPMTNVTQILPSFLVVVGVGDSVHILAVFYLRFRQTNDKRQSIAYALGHSALAIVMTSLTTAMGLFSFVTADVPPIVNLGIIAPIGVMLALFYTVILLPAMIALFPIKQKPESAQKTAKTIDQVLNWIADVACNRAKTIVMISIVITIIAVTGMLQLKFSHSGLKWLPKDLPVRTGTDYIDARMKGTTSLEVIIDSGVENGLHHPEFLNQLEKTIQYAETLAVGEVFIGKAWTLTTILKEINKALNENDPGYYKVPQTQALIAQELLLFESSGSDDLEDVVTSDFRKVRLTMKTPFKDAIKYKGLIDMIKAHFSSQYPNLSVTVTGVVPLFVAMIHNIITTMAKSYLLAFTIITFLMIVLIGRVRIGMLSMVPNLIPIACVLGLMGWFNIPMDLSNILVGSVAIGLVVDDTIHFMHNFRRYFEQTHDAPRAIHMTLQTTGRAMLITSVVLACGFFVFVFSEMKNAYNFGLLTGCSVVLALIADFFLAPALMALVHGFPKNR